MTDTSTNAAEEIKRLRAEKAVIDAAKLVREWCIIHSGGESCDYEDCPFAPDDADNSWTCACAYGEPRLWRRLG